MRTHLAALSPALLAVVGLFAAPECLPSSHRGYGSFNPCYPAAYYPCLPPTYYPCHPPAYLPCYPPGQIVAASATLFVRVPADAKLFADGKPVEGTGPMRVVTTNTIPIGQEQIVTLRAEVKGPGGDDGPPKDPQDPGPKPPPGSDGGDKGEAVTKKVSVRAFQVVHVDLTTK